MSYCIGTASKAAYSLICDDCALQGTEGQHLTTERDPSDQRSLDFCHAFRNLLRNISNCEDKGTAPVIDKPEESRSWKLDSLAHSVPPLPAKPQALAGAQEVSPGNPAGNPANPTARTSVTLSLATALSLTSSRGSSKALPGCQQRPRRRLCRACGCATQSFWSLTRIHNKPLPALKSWVRGGWHYRIAVGLNIIRGLLTRIGWGSLSRV